MHSNVSRTASLSSLRDAIANLPPDHPFLNKEVKQALLSLLDAAGNDLRLARENIENWFNSAMDRVSGWYKRRTQWIILALGLLLALLLNADTITLARSLSMDMAVRGSLAAAAVEYVNKSAAEPADAKTKLNENVKQLQKLSLPLGWIADDASSIPAGSNLRAWFMKILGWLLTAMAISVGAPFWFDLLNKFINVRSALKPPEKSS